MREGVWQRCALVIYGGTILIIRKNYFQTIGVIRDTRSATFVYFRADFSLQKDRDTSVPLSVALSSAHIKC